MVAIARWLVALLHVAVLVSASHGQSPYAAVCELRAPSHTGSGTLIGTNGDTALILSCRHVCERVGNQLTVRFPWAGNQQMPGRVEAIVAGGGFNTDLALLICKRPQNVQPVQVVSYPNDFDWSSGRWISAGWRSGQMRIATAERGKLDGGLLFLDSPFVGGQSGGATFDNYGRLVAVVVASDGFSVGVSVDGLELRRLIARYRR
jgi:hypothetical protein